jgi:hypothetical protein
MFAIAHCFIEKIKIDTLPITFSHNNSEVILEVHKSGTIDGLMLKLKERIDTSEILASDSNKAEEMTKKLITKYRKKLNEVTIMLEGLFSIYYFNPIPNFDITHVMVNIEPENEKEREILKEKAIRGAGDIFVNSKGILIKWSPNMLSKIEIAFQYLPLLSLFSQALISSKRGNEEVSFFLLFRIIEGCFSDGTANIERALKKNEDAIKNHLKPNLEFINSLVNILKNKLGLSPKSSLGDYNISNIISDLVLLRHKLIHFNLKHSKKHFYPDIRLDLQAVNKHLSRTCLIAIRKDFFND